MPVSVTCTKDRLVAIITLVKPVKNEKPISAPSIHEALKKARFNFGKSVSCLDNLLLDFGKSEARETSIKIFSDDYLVIEAAFTVHIDKEEMTAYIDANITEEQSKYVTLNSIQRVLKQAGVASGLHANNISKLINKCRKGAAAVKEFPVAAGTREVRGRDGYVVLDSAFKNKQSIKRTLKKDGKNRVVSLPVLATGKEVTKDMVLLACFLAEPGKEGLTVTGKRIWSVGNTKSVTTPNVTASRNVITKNYPDRVEYVSTVKGVGYFINDQIVEVEEIFDGDFSISISNDSMAVFLAIAAPEGGKAIDEPDIIRGIEAKGIKARIDLEAIRDGLHRVSSLEEKKIEGILIASGEEPVNGFDGYVKWNIMLEMVYKPVILADGSTDYRGGTRYPFLKAGDTAGILFLETKAGKRGINVLGEPIEPRHGIASDLSLGDIFELAPTVYEGRTARFLIAKTPGLLHVKKNTVFLEPTFQVEAVDYRTGNIDFDGNVIVKSEIAAGFTVKCTKDIHIAGNVGAATIECGGDVFIKGGMNGGGKGIIRSMGNIFLKYSENARIYSGKGIYIQSHVLVSTLASKTGITVGIQRIKGRIIGSMVFAREFIRTSFAGAERSSAASVLWAGIDKEAFDELEAASAKAYLIKLDITDLQKRIAEMESGGEDDLRIEAMKNELSGKIEELDLLNAKAIPLKNAIYNAESSAVEVSDTAFEDTRICICDKELVLSRAEKGARFYLASGKILRGKTGRAKDHAPDREKRAGAGR